MYVTLANKLAVQAYFVGWEKLLYVEIRLFSTVTNMTAGVKNCIFEIMKMLRFFFVLSGSALAANVCKKITGRLTSAIAKQEDVSVQLEALDIMADMLSR